MKTNVVLTVALAFVILQTRGIAQTQDTQENLRRIREMANSISSTSKDVSLTMELSAAITAAIRLPDSPERTTILKALKAALQVQSAKLAVVESETPFAKWSMGDSHNLRAAEISGESLTQLLGESGVETKSGQRILPKDATSLTPVGLKYRTDAGVSIAPWAILPDELARLAGWSLAREQLYTQLVSSATAAAQRATSESKRPMRTTAPVTTPAVSLPMMGGTMPADIEAQVTAAAVKEYPTDFRMREYTIKKQRAGWDKLVGYRRAGAAGVPPQVMADIIDRAIKEWGIDFTMVVYEIENQVDSYRKGTR